MPGKYNKKRKYANKKYNRKALPKNQKAIICYCPQVCPDVMRVQLKYTARKSVNTGGIGAVEDYVFRGNGLFDPDFAVGGQQPLGFDQWSAFYRRYRVYASKVMVSFQNEAAVPAKGCVAALNTSSLITDQNIYEETQFGKTVALGIAQGTGMNTVESYLSTAQVRGGPHDIVDYEADLSSTIIGDPVQEWFWHVGGYGIGTSASSVDFAYDIVLTYYVEFYDRETLPRS